MPESFETTSGWASHPVARAGYILAMIGEERVYWSLHRSAQEIAGPIGWVLGSEHGSRLTVTDAATDMALSMVRQHPTSRFAHWWAWLMSVPISMSDLRGCTCSMPSRLPGGPGISIPDPQCPVHSNLYGEGR